MNTLFSHEKEPQNTLRERISADLIRLVDATLADPFLGNHLYKLLKKLQLTVGDLKDGVLAYSLGIDEGGENSNYQSAKARITLHFHNIVKHSYHGDRHTVVNSFLEKIRPQHVIDVGYGVPGSYLFLYKKKFPELQIELLDQDPSAETFARTLIELETPTLLEGVSFKSYDMNLNAHPGSADTYIYLDSIEHTLKPTEYLKQLVLGAPVGSWFIFSLPICSMEGMENFHFAEWLTDEEAQKWLKEAGLTITEETTVHPNPEIDFFAEFITSGYHNYLALARKEK